MTSFPFFHFPGFPNQDSFLMFSQKAALSENALSRHSLCENGNPVFSIAFQIPERWFRKKLQMQGAQKLRREAPEGPRPSRTEMKAQRSRWTFYETIMLVRRKVGRRGTRHRAPTSFPGMRENNIFRITLAFSNFGSEIPPVLPFQREESFSARFHGKIPFFPPLKRGIKGDLMAFQNAKMLPFFDFKISALLSRWIWV